jgi:hypothetical protein
MAGTQDINTPWSKVYQGRQGEKHGLQDTVLIIYDTTAPRFSMIAEYPTPIKSDDRNSIIALDTALIKFKWSDYLPGDEIHSIKDLWSLE